MSKRKVRRWDRYAIRAAIHRAGSTLKAVAENAGLEESACRVALIRSHAAGEAAIAQFLNVEPSVLWPSRYPSSASVSDASNPSSTSPASPIGGSV